MTDTELEEKIYKEILAMREELRELHRVIVPEEELPEEELEELRRREAESEAGEVVPLDEVKARLRKRRR
jgi:predicted transcriptional regulator